MSSFKDFKKNRRIEKIMNMFNNFKDSFSDVSYFLWIAVPLFFLYMMLSHDSSSTFCDKVVNHKKDINYYYVYVQNQSNDYVEIRLDSLEYSDLLVEIESSDNKTVNYCYDDEIPTYWIYVALFIVSIVIFLFWSSDRYNWS